MTLTLPAAVAACNGESALFDSADLIDHLEAKETCARCPMIDACREMAATLPHKEGTWAGELWANGRRVHVYRCADCDNVVELTRYGKPRRHCAECIAKAVAEKEARAAEIETRPGRRQKRTRSAEGLPECPTCGVAAGRVCRTPNGFAYPHAARVTRHCACGEPVEKRRKLCSKCRIDTKKRNALAYLARKKRRAQEEAAA